MKSTCRPATTGACPHQRVHRLNSWPARAGGEYVLYGMQAAHRTVDNPALAVAVERANAQGLPLVVAFALMADFPEANLRHLTFMLQGLRETFITLRELGARPVLRLGQPAELFCALSARASEVILDRGYLRLHKKLWSCLAEQLECRLLGVEGEAVVPVEVASNKAEYAARTIRPRINRHLEEFLQPVASASVSASSAALDVAGLEGGLDEIEKLLASLALDRSVAPVNRFFRGGPTAARSHLEEFLQARFSRYDEQRNQPQTDFTSRLSPYLHYGMISAVEVAAAVREYAHGNDANADSYLEELVVRRGLSQNFCHFTDHYDRYQALPEWAQKTLLEHAGDERPHLYCREQLEGAETHDRYWNAAQIEMVETGYMHNYMRMYWGKKILEWSACPQEAYQTTLELNNRYFLDGRDPVSFANVAWLFGLHDRPWQERAIYGKVRCMMASGLERKSRPDDYVEKVQHLTGRRVLGLASR